MAEAVRPKKKKKVKPKKRDEESISSLTLPRLHEENLSDKSSTKEDKNLVDVLKNTDKENVKENAPADVGNLEHSKGKSENEIKDSKESPTVLVGTGTCLGETFSPKQADAAEELKVDSDLDVGNNVEAIKENVPSVLISQELDKEEETNGTVLLQGECTENKEDQMNEDLEHKVDNEISIQPTAGVEAVSESDQILSAEVDGANAKVDDSNPVERTMESHNDEPVMMNIGEDMSQGAFQSGECADQGTELVLASGTCEAELNDVDGNLGKPITQSDLCIGQNSEVVVNSEDVDAGSRTSVRVAEGVVSGYMAPKVADQSLNVSISASNVESLMPVINTHQEAMTPFTEEQLRTFYFNQELSEVPVFVDQFLKNINRESHEFYDLLNTYYKCRIGLVKVLERIEAVKKEIATCREQVWIIHHLSVIEKGHCNDKCALQEEVKYDKAEFNESEAAALKRLLKSLREHIHEEFQLKSYNCQLTRIRIECFLHELLKGVPLLREINTDTPLSAKLPRDLHHDDIAGLHALQDAITILFSFKRLGNVEEEFSKDVDVWLSTLVSILQRAGALPDYFFILNHVLRCPPGTIQGMASSIQFPSFYSIPSESIWNSPLVHHFVVMLATIALPIKERAKMLMRYKHEMKPTIERSMSWTLVDENREEDENPDHSWYLLLENDLVALFDQFPFESLFQYLLKIENIEGSFCYSATLSTSNDIIHLLAFSSCLVQILGQIFDTYNLLRYRQFVKRISRTIRWLVQIVSDHWCAYRSWRIEVCGDSDKDTPVFMTVTTQFSLERLQLEFDQFFRKATDQILNSQSVGALQFLASMPYDAISTNAAWSLLNQLISTPKDPTADQSKPAKLKSIIGEVPSTEEMIFLFTALSNMAISRSKDDREFINCVAVDLLEFTYSDGDENGSCNRDCRDMLAAISATHAFVMSALIARISQLKEEHLKNCLYLLKALSLDMWIPEAEDFEQLRNWLLGHPLNSIQHQLARTIISKINFDTKQESGVLFLPRQFHFTMAVMLVEVYGLCVPDGPGGLKELEYENAGILSQVGTFAYQSLNKIIHSQAQDDFLRWCWDVMLSLKLHSNDVERDQRNEEDRNILLSLEESQQQGRGSWSNAVLSSFENFNPEKIELDHCPELLNVKRALSTDGTLACYVALMMTQMGHSPEMFLKQGIHVIKKILGSGCADPVLRVISNVFPLFTKCPDLLEKNPGFLNIIDALVHMDTSKAGYTEKILPSPDPGFYSQMLASIITASVTSTAKRSPDLGKVVITCWLKLLVQKLNWYKDCSVLYLMDQLCKVTYLAEGSFQIIVDYFLEQYQAVISSQSSRGLFSSMVSWISSSSPVTLLEIKKEPEFAYFAYVVLLVERAYEEKLGIWQKMTSKMALKPNLQVDAAYRKAASRAKASYVPPLQYLNIYRWFEQGISTSSGHPMLPLMWQQFFMLYLQKQNTAEGLPSRIGVGYRFFDINTQAGLAKKIRSFLGSVASYHKEKGLSKESNENDELSSPSNMKSHLHDETVHATLASLFQAMALWIEESRLHDPSLFLDALPDVYKPAELTKLFQGDQEPWLQYVDKKCIEREVESLELLWTMTLNKSWKSKHVPREDSQQLRPLASLRVMKRLNKEVKPKSPTPVEVADSPIPEVSMQLLLSQPRLVQNLNDDLGRILLFAKTSCMNFDQHTALDGEYLEFLPDLYTNTWKHVLRQIPCNRGKQPCTGPAKIVLRYEEMEVQYRHMRRLEENRSVWETNTTSFVQPLPRNLCTGAVYVEYVISTLMKSVQYANAEKKIDLENAGVQLFYLFADLINGDVKRNSPAIQFFSSGTEVLGKEFIANNEAEQERLVKTIMAEEASVSFLAPHFNPSPHFRLFLHLYSTTASLFSETRLTALFVLVSKFDLRTWLSLNPPLSETTFMVRTVIAVMEKFGKVPSLDVSMLFGLFRSHLELLLHHRFPQHFSQVLTLLFESCQKGSLPYVCMQDFLSIIGCRSDEKLLSPTSIVCQVGINEAYQAIAWLSAFFAELHKTYCYSNSKLYTAWKVYLSYIARLLPYLFSKLLEPCSTDEATSTFEKDRYISKTWNDIFTIYRPWIVPHRADSAWPTLYVEDSLLMVQSFTESARLVSDLSIYNNIFSFGLNMVWAFYCSEIASCLLQDNALEIYHGLLMTLPWASFGPSMQDLNRMLELYPTNPAAFHFLGNVICCLDWPSIILQQKNHGVGDRLKEYLIGTLRVFVMLSTNKTFMAKTFSQFQRLIESAVAFPWYCVDSQNITAVSYWYAENCDPASLFENDNHEMTVLHLLKTACYMVKRNTDAPPEDVREVFQKQNTYVGVIVTIITRAASKNQISLKKLDDVLSKLLYDIERIATISSNQQFIELYSSVLALLNSVAEGPMLRCIEYRIQRFLSETNNVSAVLCILSAACRVLAGLDQLLTLSEAAIECFFNRITDMDFNESWTKILEVFLVPELNQDQFVRKALSRNCFLTLYAYNLHRISLCRNGTEELSILKETFLWCTQGVPSSTLCEKYLMIWWQIMESVKRQITLHIQNSKSTPVTNQVRQQLSKFASYCQHIGEDKTYSGILGAIGLGKKSQFPIQFRLVARSLYTFIIAQLPSSASKLRTVPDAPGSVKAKKSESPNQEAQNALQELTNLKKNKHYSQMKDDITWSCDFISNPKKCIVDGPELLSYFCKQYYFKVSYIAATVRLEGS